MTENNREVVAAVIERDGLFLICRRPAHKRHGGLWEFPGGKIEDSETLFQAAQRELSEELSLKAESCFEAEFSFIDPASGYRINFARVSCAGEPVLHEHSELKWLRASELLELELAPSDRRFVEHLNQK